MLNCKGKFVNKYNMWSESSEKIVKGERYFDSSELQESPLSITNRKSPKSILKSSDSHKSFIKSPDDKLKSAAVKKESLQKKKQKKRRIIIRNLSFKIDEKELNKVFSKYGTVTDIKIPKKEDGKKRGFAFVQFDSFKNAVKAVKDLNFKELKGRPVAIDFALPKDKYNDVQSSKVQSNDDISAKNESSETDDSSDEEKFDVADDPVSETPDGDEANETTVSDKDKKVDEFLKEFEFDINSDEEAKEKDTDSDSTDEESDKDEDQGDNSDAKKEVMESSPEALKTTKKASSNDLQEGRTVFIRNIPFNADQETFKDAMQEFGPVDYCLLCINPLTEFPRGTAFVKFKKKEDAERLIAKSAEGANNGVYFEHRKLHCIPAISRDEVKQKIEKGPKEKKDKRNLRLLREGLIMENSDEAKGVSDADLKKRKKLEIEKRLKLRNLNFFVSDTRLCIHNLPYDFTDVKLRQLFKKAVSGKSNVVEAKIIRDMQKIGAEGEAKSKGFGFVKFIRPKHALEALHKLNNNPAIFTDQRRPIVEFAIESHLAILAKKNRRERNMQNNFKKRKPKKAQHTNEAEQSIVQQKTESTNNKKRKKKVKENKPANESQQREKDEQKTNSNKKMFKRDDSRAQQASTDNPKKKNLKNRNNKGKRSNVQKAEEKIFFELVDRYKDKLLNKYES